MESSWNARKEVERLNMLIISGPSASRVDEYKTTTEAGKNDLVHELFVPPADGYY